jgi:hypothetical protein
MYTAQVQTLQGVNTYKATLTVTANAGEDNHILVVSKRTNNSVTSTNDNLNFENVASPADMLALSAVEVYPAKYRTNTITLYFVDVTDMTTVMDEILDDIQKIFDKKAILDLTLGNTYEETYFDSGSYDEDSEFVFFEE